VRHFFSNRLGSYDGANRHLKGMNWPTPRHFLLMKTFKKITDCRAAFFSAPRDFHGSSYTSIKFLSSIGLLTRISNYHDRTN
jgi:hypothetical protein